MSNNILPFPVSGEALATAAGGESMLVLSSGLKLVHDASSSEPPKSPDEAMAVLYHFPGVVVPEAESRMAVEPGATEKLTEERAENTEKYAESLSTLFALGRIAVEGERRAGQEALAKKLAKIDFVSAATEMLKTDPEFRHYLDVESPFIYDLKDGHVVGFDSDGTPMVEVVRRGVQAAQEKAKVDPNMWTQVLRNEGDVMVAEAVDALQPGESWFALSMEPKAELEQNKAYWEKLGYRKGIAYLQWYSKKDDDTLIAGSYSIDMSDEAAWKELWQQLGGELPDDVNPNTFIQHGFREDMSPEEAQQHALTVRQMYYEKQGAPHGRHSVTEYVKAHGEMVDDIFDTYYQALAEAIYTGKSNTVLRTFAEALVKNSAGMKAGIRRQLSMAAESEDFDDDLGRLMDYALRYAFVERLRAGLHDVVFGNKPMATVAESYTPLSNAGNTGEAAAAMSMSLAGNLQAGVQAGRSYGGCAAVVEFGENAGTSDSDQDSINLQDIFGGRAASKERNSKGKKSDKIGRRRMAVCIIDGCPSRPKGKTEVGGCDICLKYCQPIFDDGGDPFDEYGYGSEEDADSGGPAEEFFENVRSIMSPPEESSEHENEQLAQAA